jgi:Tfp pilus assembly protein PilX
MKPSSTKAIRHPIWMQKNRFHPRTLAGVRDRGTALIISLVILLILTILGVTAMSTSSLEQKMSGNTQEATRAFQAAESGLNQALNTAGTLASSGTSSNSFSYNSMNATADVKTQLIQFTDPARGSGFSRQNFQAANFDQTSTGRTVVGAKAVVHQGVAQIVPK